MDKDTILRSIKSLIAQGSLRGATVRFDYVSYVWLAEDFGISALDGSPYCSYGIGKVVLNAQRLMYCSLDFLRALVQSVEKSAVRNRNLF